MKQIVLMLLLGTIMGNLLAQETAPTATPKKKKANTTTSNKKKKKSNTGINDGRDWRVVYVVQAMSSSDRVAVFNNKAKLYSMFPDNRVYVKNELPFYRLRVGFFSTKEKAEKVRKQIGSTFGEPALVVKDKVVLNTIKKKIRRPGTNDNTDKQNQDAGSSK